MYCIVLPRAGSIIVDNEEDGFATVPIARKCFSSKTVMGQEVRQDHDEESEEESETSAAAATTTTYLVYAEIDPKRRRR
jgi:hypothetical protein